MMFSIVIPTYNRAHHLDKAINSVLEQVITDWELIIIDDGSTDNTSDVIDSYKDSRIKYIYQDNAERSAARNNGIRHASGDWICFLDSDDYYLPNHLESFKQFIIEENPSPSFLVSGGFEERKGELIKKPLYDPSKGEHPALYILRQTIITPISVCIHRKCFNHHMFPEVFKKAYWEDTHLWIRIAISYPFYQLPSFTNVLAEHPERSVNSKVNMNRVNDHVNMIRHLFLNYSELLKGVVEKKDIEENIDRKYNVFLYKARQNKQLYVALKIWWEGMLNNPNLYLLSEFPKIFLNKLNFGINE